MKREYRAMSKIMSKIIFSFFLVFLSSQVLTIQQAFAQGSRYYSIEVILFKHLNEQDKNNEFWGQEVMTDVDNENALHDNTMGHAPFTDDTLTWAEYDVQNRRFTPLTKGIFELPTKNYRLTNTVARLNQSDDYQLLAHFGWNQAYRSKRNTLPIRLVGQSFGEDLLPSGTLTLYASRYFHFQIDLEASQCAYNTDGLESNHTFYDKQANPQSCQRQVYVFKQNRKMNSHELHYLDNPVFGMLVYITTFKA